MPYIEGKVVNSIGNSMGGFLSILVTRFVNVSAAIAFSPQYSVCKSVIPTENRWPQYINLIDRWEYESLEGSFSDKTQYFIFGARAEMEGAQLRLFPKLQNIHKVVFRNADFGHQVVKKLKESGDLYKVIESCF